MGRILGPFGVQGWVKVKTFTDEPEALGEFDRWLVRTREGWREVALEGFEVHSKGPVAKLADCPDREAALALRGLDVAVTRAELGDAGDGAIYWVDLVGLEVVGEDGKRLGTVDGLFESGETSVLVVKNGRAGVAPSGTGSTIMIPFVSEYVKSVDREARRITVDWNPDYE